MFRNDFPRFLWYPPWSRKSKFHTASNPKKHEILVSVPLGSYPGAQKQENQVFSALALYEILLFGTMGGTTGIAKIR
jgi:hypothetical protein